MIVHRCDRDDECFCAYDPECTGQFPRVLVTLPRWTFLVLHPRRALRTLAVKREIRRLS